MKVRVVQIGARKGYAVPAVLADSNKLETLCTDFYFDGLATDLTTWMLRRIGRIRNADLILGRKCKSLVRSQVRTFSVQGILNRRGVARSRQTGNSHEEFLKGSSQFCRRVSKLSLRDVDAVYAFSSAALEVFEAAKKEKVTCILDHETAPADREVALVNSMEAKYSQWVNQKSKPEDSAISEYAERQHREANLADLIICPSTFALSQLHKSHQQKSEVLPFSMDDKFNLCREKRSPGSPTPLRVLFVGNDEIRKGLPILIEALSKLSADSFTARGAGNWNLTEFGTASVKQVMEPLGSVPRARIADLYKWADVFVMPTVSDTMGVVILEAMASGVPVVTTMNSGGPDIIRADVDGFVLERSNSDEIAKVLSLLHTDRKLLARMSGNARERALHFDRNHYGQRLTQLISHAVDKGKD